MYGELLIIFVAIIAVVIATITDIKYREVPDFLSYFLIAAGFSFRLFYSITNKDLYYFLYGLVGFGAAFLIGVGLYFTKQWGGGDTKLLMGLGVIFATKPSFIGGNNLFLLKLFFNIFLAGAVYCLFYGVYLALKNKNEFLREFKKLLNGDKIKIIRTISVIISLILLVLIFLTEDFATRIFLTIFVFLLIIYIYLWVFAKAVENVCMFKFIPVEKLTEGDWVADDIIVNKKVIYKKTKLAVDRKDILRFIKEGIKKIKIKNGLPFVPSFFIGLLLTLILELFF